VADKHPRAVNLIDIVIALFRTTRLVWCLAPVALFVAGCGSDAVRPAAAVVNGQRISISTIQDSLDRFASSKEFKNAAAGQDPEAFKRDYQQTVLSRLIRREVLSVAAEEAGVEVTEKDVSDRLDQVISDVGGQEQFETELANRNLTQEEVEGFVRDSLVEEALREEVTKRSEPTDAEIEAYYRENIDRFTEIHTQHILLKSNAEAIDISQQLRAAPPSRVDDLFAKLARKFSIDTASAKRGGDLGFVPESQFVPEYTQSVAQLDEGEISNPIRTQFGYHVVRLLGERSTPLGKIRDQLLGEIGTQRQEDAWNEFLSQAYDDADITVNSRYGELDPESHMVVNADASSIPGAEAPPPTPTPNPTAPRPTPIG
jgi:foldase protein PrsA